MSRRVSLAVLVAAVGLFLVSASPVAGAFTPGPFVGMVSQDETVTHAFDNHPPGSYCAQVIVPYVVKLDYQPATDTVNLSVADVHLVGENGHAEEVVMLSYCTAADVIVGGQDVANQAAYAVTLTRLA